MARRGHLQTRPSPGSVEHGNEAERATGAGVANESRVTVTVRYRNCDRTERLSLGLEESVSSIARKIARIFDLTGRDIIMKVGGAIMGDGNLGSNLADGSESSPVIKFYCRREEEEHSSSPPNRGAGIRMLTVGAFVSVEKLYRPGMPDSEGGQGYVKSVHNDGTFDIRWVIGNAVERNVDPARINSFLLSTLLRVAGDQLISRDLRF